MKVSFKGVGFSNSNMLTCYDQKTKEVACVLINANTGDNVKQDWVIHSESPGTRKLVALEVTLDRKIALVVWSFDDPISGENAVILFAVFYVFWLH